MSFNDAALASRIRMATHVLPDCCAPDESWFNGIGAVEEPYDSRVDKFAKHGLLNVAYARLCKALTLVTWSE